LLDQRISCLSVNANKAAGRIVAGQPFLAIANRQVSMGCSGTPLEECLDLTLKSRAFWPSMPEARSLFFLLSRVWLILMAAAGHRPPCGSGQEAPRRLVCEHVVTQNGETSVNRPEA
jgi:hypothetical protein